MRRQAVAKLRVPRRLSGSARGTARRPPSGCFVAPPPRTGVGSACPSRVSARRAHRRGSPSWSRRSPTSVAAVGHHRRRVQAAGGRQVDGHRVAPTDAEQCGHVDEAERHDAGGDDGDRGQDRQLGSTGQGTVFLTSRSTTTGSSMSMAEYVMSGFSAGPTTRRPCRPCNACSGSRHLQSRGTENRRSTHAATSCR